MKVVRSKFLKLVHQGRTRMISIGAFLSDEMYDRLSVKVVVIKRTKKSITFKISFLDDGS